MARPPRHPPRRLMGSPRVRAWMLSELAVVSSAPPLRTRRASASSTKRARPQGSTSISAARWQFAVLGDPDAIEVRMITASERGPILQSGEVDMLVFVTTWTTSRDTYWGNFVQTMFYDGQGFMVPSGLGVDSAYGLGGASVCVTSGTTTELNMADFFRQNNLEYDAKVFEESQVALESYASGACDAFTSDRSALTALRSTLANPAGPYHPAGDDLRGASWTCRAPRRRAVVRHRQGCHGHAHLCRGVRRPLRQRGRHGRQRQREGQASARRRGGLWAGGVWTRPNCGPDGHQGRWQLRPDL